MAKNWILDVALVLPLFALSGYASAQSATSEPPSMPIPDAIPPLQPLPSTLSEKARVAISTNAAANPNTCRAIQLMIRWLISSW